MAFIRAKRIRKVSGNSYLYAYLVENRWRKRPKTGDIGSRQKVKKYLGRAYEFNKKESTGFLEFAGISDLKAHIEEKGYKGVIEELLRWEAYRHGIEGFEVDAEKVRKEGANCVIKLNEGFLCEHTLKRLLGFVATGDDREDGIELAECFVEAGIDVPKEVFIGLFERVGRRG